MKTPVFFGTTLAAVFVLACAGYASGAVITYDESVNGDLPAGTPGTPLPILALDVGTNTVKGTIGMPKKNRWRFLDI
jgi:hypothetical protein